MLLSISPSNIPAECFDRLGLVVRCMPMWGKIALDNDAVVVASGCLLGKIFLAASSSAGVSLVSGAVVGYGIEHSNCQSVGDLDRGLCDCVTCFWAQASSCCVCGDVDRWDF